MNGGSLHGLLTKNQRSLNESELRDIFRQVALGLQHIHSANLIHRDLAARNILLDVDETSGKITPRVSDFGMSRAVAMDMKEGYTKTTFGPIPWMSPEAIGKLQYSTASDVWSLGILLWEMVTGGRDPGAAMALPDLALAIRDTNYHPPFPPFLPKWAEKIMRGCWEPDPTKRIKIEEVLDVCDESWTSASEPQASSSASRSTISMPRSLFGGGGGGSSNSETSAAPKKKKSKAKNNAAAAEKVSNKTNRANKSHTNNTTNKSYGETTLKQDNPFLLPQPPAELMATLESLRAKVKALEANLNSGGGGSGGGGGGSSNSSKRSQAAQSDASRPPPRRGASKKRWTSVSTPDPSAVRNTIDV